MRSIARLALALLYVTAGCQATAHHRSEISSTSDPCPTATNSSTGNWPTHSSWTVPACTFCRPVVTNTFQISGVLTTDTATSCTTISPCTETNNPWGTPTYSDTATASETASCWVNGVPWPCTKETSGLASTSTVETTVYETVPCSNTGATITASHITSGVPYPTTNGTSVSASATATPSFLSSARGTAENLDMKVKMGFLALMATVLVACVL